VSIFDYFRSKKSSNNNTASLAKERLQIIVAHERGKRDHPGYVEKMQQEIIDVIKKYIPIDNDKVTVSLDNSDGCSILELNVTLPDK